MNTQILIILTISMLSTSLRAQYYMGPIGLGNPNNINQEDLEYPMGGGLPAGWTQIHAGNALTAQWTAVQTLPFAFQFNGNAVSTFKVSTSGVLTFTTSATTVPSYIHQNLPSNALPAQSICVWGLAGKSSNDFIVTKTFGTAPNRQFWVTFSAYSVATLTTTHYTYWSIVLEEGTNAIYIVDQRTSPGTNMGLTLGLQLTAGSSGSYIAVAGSPNVNRLAGDDPSRADNRHYAFYPGSPAVNELKAVDILLSEILTVNNAPYTVRLVVKNQGLDTVESVDLNYANSANLKTSATLTGLQLFPNATDTLFHPITWTPGAGNTILKVWTELPNGVPDDNPLNDTAFKPLTIIQNGALRVPLMESFTSSTSAPSAAMNSLITSAMNQFSGTSVHVKYPMNWPGTGDPYFTTEGGIRRQYYNITTLPYLHLDGRDMNSFGNTVNDSVLAHAQNRPCYINLVASATLTGKTVCATVNYTPLVSLPNITAKLYVAIVEVTSTQNVKSSGETEFYHIMKKMLPNANGTSTSSLQAGVTNTYSDCFSFQGSYVLPANATQQVNLNTNHTIENFSDLGIVAWLQNETTKEVLQAAWAPAISNVGVEENSERMRVTIFPIPAHNQLFIGVSTTGKKALQAELISLTGQRVLATQTMLDTGMNTLEVNLPSLPRGIYLLQLLCEGETSVHKIVIE